MTYPVTIDVHAPAPGREAEPGGHGGSAAEGGGAGDSDMSPSLPGPGGIVLDKRYCLPQLIRCGHWYRACAARSTVPGHGDR